jgi:hypothetical protein
MLDYILANPERVLTAVTTVVSIASVATASTPTPAPETFLGKLYRIIEVLALVVGKAKQK